MLTSITSALDSRPDHTMWAIADDTSRFKAYTDPMFNYLSINDFL